MKWFVDFDDTLVLGPTTWALQTVIPTMIKDNALRYDPQLLDKVLLESQEKAAIQANDIELLDNLFRVMGWPDELKKNLLYTVFENYKPAVFEDTLPFLKRVAERGDTIYILSNNNKAAEIAQHIGLSSYMTDMFVPKACGVERGKPYRDMWDHVTAHCDVQDAVLIGDDPWSDGAFATTCQIPCYILDRLKRFTHLSDRYRLVTTLDELP